MYPHKYLSGCDVFTRLCYTCANKFNDDTITLCIHRFIQWTWICMLMYSERMPCYSSVPLKEVKKSLSYNERGNGRLLTLQVVGCVQKTLYSYLHIDYWENFKSFLIRKSENIWVLIYYTCVCTMTIVGIFNIYPYLYL